MEDSAIGFAPLADKTDWIGNRLLAARTPLSLENSDMLLLINELNKLGTTV